MKEVEIIMQSSLRPVLVENAAQAAATATTASGASGIIASTGPTRGGYAVIAILIGMLVYYSFQVYQNRAKNCQA